MTVNAAQKFLVFAFPRTGSTALMDALNLHPNIQCLHEPFNPENLESRHNTGITSRAALLEALAEIFDRYDGIKHVFDPSGWPFDNGSTLNMNVLVCGARVVLMRRQNVLRRLVSLEICRQTNAYTVFKLWPIVRGKTFKFAKLDNAVIRKGLQEDSYWHERVLQELNSRGIPTFELDYERLFNPDAGANARLACINEVFRFLVRPELKSERLPILGIQQVLSPAHKVLGEEIYAAIPAIDEIESEFGSDATGWLFRAGHSIW
jgi:hypothetical protein